MRRKKGHNGEKIDLFGQDEAFSIRYICLNIRLQEIKAPLEDFLQCIAHDVWKYITIRQNIVNKKIQIIANVSYTCSILVALYI